MPVLYMMVGIPGSGKSTWVKNYLSMVDPTIPYAIISTDDYVEKKAKEEGKTYSEVFEKYYPAAEAAVIEQVKLAVASDFNIIWDQTNLTKKTRAKKLSLIPDHYSKYYCFHETPDIEELTERLNSRPGKIIPRHIIETMIKHLEPPSFDEGFHGYVR